MNRAEKRRLERDANKSQKVYTLTQAQIDEIKRDISIQSTKRAFHIMLAFPLMAMRDEFGFGKKRLQRIIDRILETYDAYEEKYITLEDLHTAIEDETGVAIMKYIREELK